MKTKYTVVIEIVATHDKDTFVDTNSVKGLVGHMVSAGGFDNGARYLVQYDEKNEQEVENHTVKVKSINENWNGNESGNLDLSDLKEYIHQ